MSSHNTTLMLNFDWRDAQEADPKGMLVYFYPTVKDDENTYYLFEFKNNTGGEISIPQGLYNVVCYNNDSEIVGGYDVANFETHYLYTRGASLLEPISGQSYAGESLDVPVCAEEEYTVIPPDRMYGTSVEYLEVTSDTHLITLYPHNLVCHYSYEVRNIAGLDAVESISAIITGMSPSLSMAKESHSGSCAILPVPAAQTDLMTVSGEFLTFGHNPDIEKSHLFGLYIKMKSGKVAFISDNEKFDVTEQIHNAPNPRRIHFIIEGVDIATDDYKPSEVWKTEIDDYNNQYINIEL